MLLLPSYAGEGWYFEWFAAITFPAELSLLQGAPELGEASENRCLVVSFHHWSSGSRRMVRILWMPTLAPDQLRTGWYMYVIVLYGYETKCCLRLWLMLYRDLMVSAVFIWFLRLHYSKMMSFSELFSIFCICYDIMECLRTGSILCTVLKCSPGSRLFCLDSCFSGVLLSGRILFSSCSFSSEHVYRKNTGRESIGSSSLTHTGTSGTDWRGKDSAKSLTWRG